MALLPSTRRFIQGKDRQKHSSRRAPARERGGIALLLYRNGLTITVLGCFVICILLQSLAGHRVYNDERRDDGQPSVSYSRYLISGDFIEAVGENWESEFFQIAIFAWLTSFLYQKGSAESHDPDKKEEHKPVRADSPWPVRRGGWILKLYERSISIAFLCLFAISFFIHASGGAREYSQQEILHGRAGVSMLRFILTSTFWAQSMQNWQSEFLGIAAMVLVTIWLRQRNSPESKAVETPHGQNE